MEEDSNVLASVVETKDLPGIWDQVAELLQPACDRSHGQDTIQTLRASLMRGSEGLFVVQDGDDIIGAVTFQTTDYDNGAKAPRYQLRRRRCNGHPDARRHRDVSQT